MHFPFVMTEPEEDNYEPDYEPETILIGDNIYLEVLSVIGISDIYTENFYIVPKIVKQN